MSAMQRQASRIEDIINKTGKVPETMKIDFDEVPGLFKEILQESRDHELFTDKMIVKISKPERHDINKVYVNFNSDKERYFIMWGIKFEIVNN